MEKLAEVERHTPTAAATIDAATSSHPVNEVTAEASMDIDVATAAFSGGAAPANDVSNLFSSHTHIYFHTHTQAGVIDTRIYFFVRAGREKRLTCVRARQHTGFCAGFIYC